MPTMSSCIKLISVVAFSAALFSCSSGNGSAPIVDANGKHPAEWVDQHWIQFRQTLPSTAKLAGKLVNATAAQMSASPCAECHGTNLLGGISKVSCFSPRAQNGQSCHAIGPVTGAHGWANVTDHGNSGAKAAPGVSTGFAYCVKCHGDKNATGADRYKGNANIGNSSCLSCHTTAPHPARPWLGGTTSHTTTSPGNAAECFNCHANGNNFGPVLVSTPLATSPAAPTPDCFNNTLCHGGDVNPPHVRSAAYLAASQHGIDAAGKNSANPELNLANCKVCHAGSTTRFNLPQNNMPNGCETCHAANTAHPTPWLPGRVGTPFNIPNTTTHASVSVNTMTTACALCHVTSGTTGSVPGVAAGIPPCMSCHTASSPVANPTGCTSCHAVSPVSGAHAKHLALPNVTCQACHFGAGASSVNNVTVGTVKHADGTIDVALLNVDFAGNSFIAKTGTFSLNADKSCASVRCHGGQTTPAWTAPGSITVATDCLKCHEQGLAPQTPQFNSFFSGSFGGTNLHQFHLSPAQVQAINPAFTTPIVCTDCHNIATLTTQQHFGALAGNSFTAPGNTIGGGSTGIGNYDTAARRCNNVACHAQAPQSAPWLGI